MTSSRYFPHIISHPFLTSLRLVFLFAAGMTLVSAILSVFRGRRFIYDDNAVEPTSRPQASAVLLALSAVWMAKDGASAIASFEREQQLRRSLALLSLSLGHTPSQDATLSQDEMQRIAETSDRPMATDQRA